MSLQPIRVGIIGTGFGAKVQAPMFQSHSGFEVVSIASVHRGNIATIQEQTQIQNVYTNWTEMLEKESLDLVSVVSSPDLHHLMVLAALEKGAHILCEKPMAFDQQQTEEMLSALKHANRQGYIHFEYRYLPARSKVKELLSLGKLGQVLHVRYLGNFKGYERLTSQPLGWLGQTKHGGGMLGAIGSHMFDSLLWWMDCRITEVYGQLFHHVPVLDQGGQFEERTADDGFSASGCFENGATFTVDLTFANQHISEWSVQITGTNGTLVADDQKVYFGQSGTSLEEVELVPAQVAPSHLNEVAARYYPAAYPFLDALHQSLVTGVKHPCLASFEDGHEVQKVLDAIRLSSAQKQAISL